MFELETLTKAGLQGWPLVAGLAVVCVSFVAWWNGKWPWTGIVIHKHYDKRKRNEEDED